MADRVGQHLGNYQLVRLIGRGGFAEVYLGMHIYLDMPAAIKVLHAQLARDDAEQFRSEARIIARLVHPNIVRVLEFGIEGTTPFLVFDYAPNGTLRKLYPRGVKLPLTTVVSQISQVADALQYAHDQKVIHRDVKPENMLLGRRYEVLLSDFGIALVAQSTRRQSAENVQDLAGTIAYMAPEQIQSRAVPASDQYSLAVVAYEWLGGERPFQGSFTEIAIKHTLVPPLPLREKVPDLPVEIESVIMKALSKEPEARFPTVKAFAVALEQVWRETLTTTSLNEGGSFINPSTSGLTPLLSDQGIAPAALLPPPEERFPSSLSLSGASPPAEEDEPSSRTMPLPDDGEAAAFVETLSTPTPTDPGEHIDVEIPALSSPIISVEKQESAEQAALVVPSPPTISEELLEELREPVLATIDQPYGISRRAALIGLTSVLVLGAAGAASWLVYSEESHQTAQQATSVSTIGSMLFSYGGHSDLIWAVAWSPNGDLLASAGSDRTVQVWKATSGSPVYTYTNHTDTVYGVTWSPDSKRIASASYDQTVQVWNAADGYYPYSYNGHSSWVWCVAWSHDGRYLASAGGDKRVMVWDAANGDPVLTYRGHSGNIYGLAWSPDSKELVSTSNDKTAREWEALTGRDIFVYSPYSTTIWAATWSPDGTRIAVACDNETVQVWDAVGGDHVYVYYGHSDFVYAVAWSPDGKRIASAGDDKTVQVWDAMDGGHPYTYTGHTASVRSLAWSPDGTRIASASWDRTVQVWEAR